jgi:tetratricopeptide (TPR) repeat protein
MTWADLLPDEPAVGASVGRYRIVDRLGSGGMGVVYKAFDPQLDRLVALKVLREAFAETGGLAARLDAGKTDGTPVLTEARTLARLSHPNVVQVFDAGVVDDVAFIAMELVDGITLEQWLTGSHTIRERIAAFVQAGRGLAAAHAAGIEHRDFKPANVLIRESPLGVDAAGGIRVADFGLATLAPRPEHADLDATTEPDLHVSRIFGTPEYMAPERLLGEQGDHRQDQFSFCVALYTALFGKPPFADTSFAELRASVCAGLDPRARERLLVGRSVPSRVRRALLRGLSIDPDRRFASMDELVRELEERRRWPWALASGALAMGVGMGAMLGGVADEACDDPRAALHGTWSDEDRQTLRQSFEATSDPRAAELFRRTSEHLDAYAEAWTATHAQICRASFVTREQSAPLHDARMQCLARARNRHRAAIDALVEPASLEVLQSRMLAAFRLPPPDACETLEVAPERVPLPDDPELRARIEAQLARVDIAATLRDASDVAHGIEVASDAVAVARELDHPPLLALALETLGHLQADGARGAEAEATLREAIVVASRSHEHGVEARAWASLMFSKLPQGAVSNGLLLSLAAEAAVERAADEQARAWWLNSRGTLYAESKQWDRAFEDLHAALAIKRALLGDEHVDVGIAWFNLGTMFVLSGRVDDARDALSRAKEAFAATVGRDHDYHQLAVASECWAELERERFSEALELCRQVLTHFERSPSSPRTMGLVHFRTAKALVGLGRIEEAEPLARRARDLLADEDPQRAQAIAAWMDEAAATPTP